MELITSKAIGKCRRPGFLTEPLGWVQDRLTKAIEVKPNLIELLFDIDHARMHLMALALAHLPNEIIPDLALMLLQGSRNTILNFSLGQRPIGIDRVLSHLPPRVLSAESYRNLIDLLNDPATAKFLHHRASIPEPIITGLHSLPLVLRTAAIMAMFNRIDEMTRFVDGLRILAMRAGLPFDLLAKEIGALDQPDQIAANIRQVVDSLPLFTTLPPVQIGGFRRLDTVAEIRDLAKKWQNCLAGYLYNVNDGSAAIYLAEPLEAVCAVGRQGRIGWVLLQAKGPRNIDIDPDQLAEIYATFSDAGIPPSSMIEAIKAILQNYQWSRRRQIADDDDILTRLRCSERQIARSGMTSGLGLIGIYGQLCAILTHGL